MTELFNSRSNKHVSIQLDFNFENIELVGYETFLELEMKFLDVLEETWGDFIMGFILRFLKQVVLSRFCCQIFCNEISASLEQSSRSVKFSLFCASKSLPLKALISKFNEYQLVYYVLRLCLTIIYATSYCIRQN